MYSRFAIVFTLHFPLGLSGGIAAMKFPGAHGAQRLRALPSSSDRIGPQGLS